MGVDITAYSRVQFVLCDKPSGWCEDDSHHAAFAYACHWRSAEGIPGWNANSHTINGEEFVGDHCFTETPETKTLAVFSMPYTAYNRWRERLARAVFGVDPEAVWHRPDMYADKPFFEIVNFADNEGCIGSVACARLVEAFADDAARTRFVADGPEWQGQSWDDFRAGVTLAAAGGLIRYH